MVNYPGLDTVYSDPCTVTVHDVTNYGPVLPKAQQPCIYANSTSFRSCVLVSKIASVPAAPRCNGGNAVTLKGVSCKGTTASQTRHCKVNDDASAAKRTVCVDRAGSTNGAVFTVTVSAFS